MHLKYINGKNKFEVPSKYITMKAKAFRDP